MNRLKLLWKFMKGNRLIYIGAVLSIGLATFASIINPLVLKVSIDSVIGDKALKAPSIVMNSINKIGGIDFLENNLWISAIVLVILTMIQGIFLYFKGKWSAQAAESIAKNIRESVYDHLQHQPYDYHVKSETGDLIQRCTSDVDTIRRFLAIQFVEIGRAIFMISFVAIIMFSLNVKMALISMAVVPIIFAFSVIFFLKVKKAFKLSDESEAEMSTVLQENLSGVRVVRAFSKEKFEIDKFEEKNENYRYLTYKLIRLLAGYWALSDLLCLIQIGSVLILGVYWATTGAITLGTLVVFTSYEGMLLWPVRQLGRILTDLGKSLVSLERIGEILDEPREEIESNELTPEIKGNIKFENVSFSYENDNKTLDNISFEVNKGETIAIMGQTGSGKSSLVHLLARLYEYNSGSIKIDGIELKNIQKKWIRKHVGIVLQEPFLFSRSIKDNISLAKLEAKEAEIIESARVAAIHNVIEDFERGYDTKVGEKGVTLSGGQKQRIAIARTLINNSPILIFDDSLSAVDTETDLAIRKALEKRKSGVTTFIISHRVSTIAGADKIIVLENGKIVQSGNHEELIKRKGLYKRVWTIQNSLETEMDKIV
ncbi:ABC transporter ATP-binding protein [Clostridium sp. D2Q-11]|uniref:ABC transporter ATP-binding protein n=1 Tax=Anaeromonas frigoriresistens TaxID=2683708 RepID=A0A942UQP4_9FIRM|nr:ABC transporter ATP-binding protein [Anaeromonas frigoriresistens]MBS4537438.1 ABC transporter ATP-binding protein [Anaeromonas frigoriresistens]